MLKSVNGHYAQANRIRGITGHLWQGRYFSSPLDAQYFLNAVRYVELNPVRACLVDRAETYEWSSAAAHCGISIDPVVGARPQSTVFRGIEDWANWLATGLRDEMAQQLRRNSNQNLPCGTAEFIAELERRAGRDLQFRPHGVRTDRTRRENGRGERPLLI